MNNTSEKPPSESPLANGNSWDSVAALADGKPETTWDSLAELQDVKTGAAAETSTSPEASTTQIDLFADTLHSFYDSLSKYNDGGLDDAPVLTLDRKAADGIIAVARSEDGRRALIDTIISQGNSVFGEELQRQQDESGMDAVQMLGFLAMGEDFSERVFQSDELEKHRPMAEVLSALGFEAHFSENGLENFNFCSAENLINLGLAAEELHNAVHHREIDGFFSRIGAEVPGCLREQSEETQSFWNEQSRAIGADALSLTLRLFESDIWRTAKDGEQNGAWTIEDIFTDDGRLREEVFIRKDGIIRRFAEPPQWDSHFLYPFTDKHYAKFLTSNVGHFPEEKQWIVQEIDRQCFSESGTFSKENFNAIRQVVSHAGAWDNSAMIGGDQTAPGPSRRFWERAISCTYCDTEIIKRFDGYDVSTNDSEKAFMRFSYDLRRQLIGDINYSRLTSYSNSFSNILPNLFTAEGTATDVMARFAAKDNGIYEIIRKIDPEIDSKMTPLERRFASLPKEIQGILSGYGKEQEFKDLLAESDPDKLSSIIQCSLGNKTLEKYIAESKIDLDALDLPPLILGCLRMEDGFRSAIEDGFDPWRIGRDYSSPLLADAYLEHISKSSEQQKRILGTFSKITDPIAKKEFDSFVCDKDTDYEGFSDEFLDKLPAALTRMASSNASEVRASRSALAHEIMAAGGDPEKSVERIEAIFLRNHLPYFAKAYLTFRTLHPDNRLAEKINGGTVSPVLKAEQETQRLFMTPDYTIFADMVNCAVRSNNRSVREFIGQVEAGQALTDQILSGEKSVSNLEAADRSALEDFAQQLTILYNQSLAGQRNPINISGVPSESELRDLVSAFGPTSRHSLGDRIVRMYASPAGFDSIETAKTTLDRLAEEQTERHRKLVEDGKITLEVGDIVKGLGSVQYVSNILQNGSLSKEYLGDSAGSDSTPLDTDVAVVRKVGGTLSETISGTAANGYGGEQLWIAMKRDDRFAVTRENPAFADNVELSEPSYDRSKLELFYTGVVGQDHYGIRTGFPSSDIDFFIKGGDTDRLELEIVKNGFYIPIVNPEGELVFTPDDYDRLRERTAGQNYYGNPNFVFGHLESPEITEIASRLSGNAEEVASKRSAIQGVIREALSEVIVDGKPLALKTSIDGDITPGAVELIDTGSTGRGTNVPGDGDFDFIMRLDRSVLDNPALLEQIKSGILSRVSVGRPGEAGGDFRHKDVEVPGLSSPVDIDISFLQRTNKMEHSTDAAVRDVLASIAAESERERAAEIAEREASGLPTDNLGPTRYEYVIANIIAAKEFFKSAPVHAYKPARGEKPQGGLGGVGVENWVLQHGGSFEDAARDLLAAAQRAEAAAGSELIAGDETVNSAGGSPNEKVFREFQKIYRVWDFGQNHFAVRDNENGGAYRFPHDNFVFNNMSAGGFSRIVLALRERFSDISES